MKEIHLRILSNLLISCLLIACAVIFCTYLNQAGIVLAVPVIEGAIYALWHTKNIFLDHLYRSDNAKTTADAEEFELPVAKKDLATEYRTQAVKTLVDKENHKLNFFKRSKKKDESVLAKIHVDLPAVKKNL